jgi:4-hydroxybenzoate polyprenyltransferase
VLRAYLDLLRPANVATALGDVLAGFAVAGLAGGERLPWLLLASACLYAGGVVLNDVFDRDVDARERPERPLPSGRVRTRDAAILGGLLLAAGIASGATATASSGFVAAAVAAAVLVYDGVTKKNAVLGPATMGLCRGLNLALGMTAAPAVLGRYWPLCLIPMTYIAGVTLISRGEVSGGRRPAGFLAAGLVAASLAALAGVAALQRHPWPGLAWTAILGWRVIPAFVAAARDPSPATIRLAVKTGVLSLILLDAALAASFAGLGYSVVLLAAALAAGWLARSFAVT